MTSVCCPICSSVRSERFDARILRKYQVRYFYCGTCGLLQTEEPYWLEEAYSRAIAESDTGLVARNLNISFRLGALLYFCFDRDAQYLDFAGGYGLLTRLMRDVGFDFRWHDPYCENVLARGFDWDNVQRKAKSAAVTAFEVLEHVTDPLAFVRNALEQANSSTLIFSTELYKDEPPSPQDWWYYALETGQHISFYRRETLVVMARKLGLHLFSNRSFHVLTTEKLHRMKFNVCSGRLARLLAVYVQRRMNSRTFRDREFVATGEK
jgi:hypothetical protein